MNLSPGHKLFNLCWLRMNPSSTSLSKTANFGSMIAN